MTTAVDTNVLVALWDADESLNGAAQSALDTAQSRGGLVIPAPVFAELMAFPRRTVEFLENFCAETGIQIDWKITEAVWKAAGRAFEKYAAHRRKDAQGGPRRILADFVIGAYAAEHGFPLLTLDRRLYRTAFPRVEMPPV
jgi:predicted nucleic acid-binding protein